MNNGKYVKQKHWKQKDIVNVLDLNRTYTVWEKKYIVVFHIGNKTSLYTTLDVYSLYLSSL